ncbi:MAG: elongation factor 1-beta [archaeon]
MAQAILTIKIMMESPEVDLSKVEEDSKKLILELEGEVGKVEIEPIAFGLKALKLYIVMDESIGSDVFEEKLKTVENVQSVEVVDFRRALG